MNFDSICDNRSWATVRCEPTLDRAGRDVAVVVARLAYAVTPGGRATVAFRPVRFGESRDGHGGLKFPADLVDEKPGTDVALVGTAFPPRGKPVDKTLAWVQAGQLRKVVTVYGPRRFVADWSGVVPGPPGTLEPTPLRFDHCWGGHEHTSAAHESDPFNPVGRGFATDPKTLVGKLAPALEPVDDLRSGQKSHRSHGCFAPIPESFEPRRRFAGTYDPEWARTRAPIRPKDFDVAHNSWAVPELRSSTPLPTDTPFEVAGIIPEGIWRFKLPLYGMEFESTLLGEKRVHPSHLDSVIIDADERVVELTFRASIVLPRKWAMLERIRAYGVGDMPAEALDTTQMKQRETTDARASSGAEGAGG